jgi:hypothetical protein
MNTEDKILTEAEFHKKMAIRLFNETWKLLDKPERTPEEDARMSHTAHASRLHWDFVGSAENFAIGEWQVARVHAVLQQPEAALFHARRSLEIATLHLLRPFIIACAHEAVARALSLTQPAAAAEHIAAARQMALEITDPEEKNILDEDLSTIDVPVGNAAA